MTQRYDIITPRARKDGKTFWLRIGTAFEKDGAITGYLDASPYPDAEGRVVIRLSVPRENGDRAAQQSQRQSADMPDDGDIPF